MIPVLPVAEPAGFNEKAREPGNEWLKANPGAERPRDYWSPFRDELMRGFKELCGYSAMFDPNGTIDHHLPFKSHPKQAYEWTNYRYATHWVNSSKKARNILDPYEVQEGWFEVLLPSMQLVVTSAAPQEVRLRAEAKNGMLDWLNGERFTRLRQQWYREYTEHEVPLEYLKRRAPLIAAALEKKLHGGNS